MKPKQKQNPKSSRAIQGSRAARITALLLAGAVVGYLVRGGGEPRPTSVGEQGPTAEAQAELWTCSMHPQIQEPSPGQCPICGMDLIPVTPRGDSRMGLRRLVVSPAEQALMRIRTVPVERRAVEATLNMVGKIAYDETRLGHITAWVPGRIDRLFVDYTGVTVNAGDHMVYLYSPDLFAAQEELLQAKKALEQLGRSGVTAVTERTEATVRAARAKLRLWGLTDEQVEEIEGRGTALEHITIHAPVGGIVIDKTAQEGMYVSTGTRIFTIADLSSVWVLLEAYESDLAWLRYGQGVVFETEAYPGEVFAGTISFIDPVLDTRTRTVKVRAIASNAQGRLKPEMFVRATVRAPVSASRGVMDPALAGKWVSPMHPEIVKDEPGTCDVCEMPLVPAESLYARIAPPGDSEKPPFVIPVSAALVTGRRAIVYVEVPGAPEPTYEGREVVLGPRAGDWYVVRHGLTDGELVVVEGNFKIDSALQIQAKPSMMSPEGGRAGGHAHDHGSGPGDEQDMADMSMEEPPLSSEGHEVVRALEKDMHAIAQALESQDLRAVQERFSDFASRIEDANMAAFEGSAHATWMEFSMRLGNDAFEGRSAKTLPAARTALEALEGDLTLLIERLGLSPDERDQVGFHAPDRFLQQVHALWTAYQGLQGALAKDDLETGTAAVEAVRNARAALDMTLLEGDAHAFWMGAAAPLDEALGGLGEARDLDQMRAAFEPLSSNLAPTLRAFRPTGAADIYELHCPMAFDGRGARWLQADREVANPYFGSAMLRCGSIVSVIGPDNESVGETGHDH